MERFGEGQGAVQEMKGHGRTTERQREAELWQKQGQRWAEAQRELESGARWHFLPPEIDLYSSSKGEMFRLQYNAFRVIQR